MVEATMHVRDALFAIEDDAIGLTPGEIAAVKTTAAMPIAAIFAQLPRKAKAVVIEFMRDQTHRAMFPIKQELRDLDFSLVAGSTETTAVTHKPAAGSISWQAALRKCRHGVKLALKRIKRMDLLLQSVQLDRTVLVAKIGDGEYLAKATAALANDIKYQCIAIPMIQEQDGYLLDQLDKLKQAWSTAKPSPNMQKKFDSIRRGYDTCYEAVQCSADLADELLAVLSYSQSMFTCFAEDLRKQPMRRCSPLYGTDADKAKKVVDASDINKHTAQIMEVLRKYVGPDTAKDRAAMLADLLGRIYPGKNWTPTLLATTVDISKANDGKVSDEIINKHLTVVGGELPSFNISYPVTAASKGDEDRYHVLKGLRFLVTTCQDILAHYTQAGAGNLAVKRALLESAFERRVSEFVQMVADCLDTEQALYVAHFKYWRALSLFKALCQVFVIFQRYKANPERCYEIVQSSEARPHTRVHVGLLDGQCLWKRSAAVFFGQPGPREKSTTLAQWLDADCNKDRQAVAIIEKNMRRNMAMFCKERECVKELSDFTFEHATWPPYRRPWWALASDKYTNGDVCLANDGREKELEDERKKREAGELFTPPGSKSTPDILQLADPFWEWVNNWTTMKSLEDDVGEKECSGYLQEVKQDRVSYVHENDSRFLSLYNIVFKYLGDMDTCKYWTADDVQTVSRPGGSTSNPAAMKKTVIGGLRLDKSAHAKECALKL